MGPFQPRYDGENRPTPVSRDMSKLEEQIALTLLPGMSLPEPLKQLFSWIESRGFYVDTGQGRIGFLFSEAEMKAGWTKSGRPGGTHIEFAAEGNKNLTYWFGHERQDVLNRLCVFAKTGADGSMAAFWLDPNGQQKIVHLGSGSGSMMVCVLANTPVDFLRLLAIGYDEICWSEEFSEPPVTNSTDRAFTVQPNSAFQEWVRAAFGVTIPFTASEIVEHPDEMGRSESQDEFNRWVEANVA